MYVYKIHRFFYGIAFFIILIDTKGKNLTVNTVAYVKYIPIVYSGHIA